MAITAAGPVLPWVVTPVMGAIGPKIPGPDDFINTAKPGMALDEASRRTNIKYPHRSPPSVRGPVFAFLFKLGRGLAVDLVKLPHIWFCSMGGALYTVDGVDSWV